MRQDPATVKITETDQAWFVAQKLSAERGTADTISETGQLARCPVSIIVSVVSIKSSVDGSGSSVPINLSVVCWLRQEAPPDRTGTRWTLAYLGAASGQPVGRGVQRTRVADLGEA